MKRSAVMFRPDTTRPVASEPTAEDIAERKATAKALFDPVAVAAARKAYHLAQQQAAAEMNHAE